MRNTILVAIACVLNLANLSGQVQSFRDSEDIPPKKLRRLTSLADRGDVDASLAVARYYWLKKQDLKATERFLRLAAHSGTRKACDALISFYITPAGIFRPETALTLRREFRRRHGRELGVSDKGWAYQSSWEYRYSDNPETVSRRRTLLRLAKSLGSKEAEKELRYFNRLQSNPVQVAPAHIERIVD